MNDIDPKYIQKLPEDVIMNHILPYTYQPQPHRVMRDIRSFVNDYSTVENLYMTQLNELILLNDLLRFCRINLNPSYGINHLFQIILRRHVMLSKKSEAYLITKIRVCFHRNSSVKTESKIRFIWGLLKPFERANFIQKYINR